MVPRAVIYIESKKYELHLDFHDEIHMHECGIQNTDRL
jgi:hypothetical protein